MIRQISWRFLTDGKGMSGIDAAQRAALIHGDYAGVPGKTRRALNLVFFTPTFKVAMAKAYLSMINDAGKVIQGNPNADTYDNAMGLIRILGVLTAIDTLMVYGLGWEREEFGRLYKRLTDTDEGTKELVVNLGGPHNLAQKFIGRWIDATAPEVTNSMEKLLRSMSWELHPIWRKVIEITTNKDTAGKEIVGTFMSGREKWIRRTHHALTGIVSMYRILFAEGIEDPKAVAAFRKESGQLLEMIMSPFAFKYLRSAPDLRLERDVQRINTLINKYINNPELEVSQEELDNALHRIKLIIENYDKKAKLMNLPSDHIDDELLKPSLSAEPKTDVLRTIDFD